MTATLPPAGHVADLLPAFVNRTLPQAERAQVMGHLTRCPACAAELRAWQAIQQATHDLPLSQSSGAATGAVLDRIWARLDQAAPPPSHASTTLPPTRRPSQEDSVTTTTYPITPTTPTMPDIPAPPLRLSRRQALLALAGAAALALPLSGAPQRLAERLRELRLSGVLPWQEALPPDVPTYRGNWQHTGGTDSPGPSGKPGVLWEFQSDGPMRNQPVLLEGVLFASSEDGNVYAIDSATGETRWKHEIGGLPTSTMSATNGLVFAGDNDPYRSYGTLFVLDAADGHEVWRLADAQTSAPLVIDGVLYTGTGDGLLHAYDAANGTERWQVQGALMSRGFTFAEGLLYYGGKDQFIYALDAATGAERWRYQAGQGQLGTVGVTDGLVYEIVFDGPANALYVLDAATGEERWSFASNARVQPPAVHEGMAYLPTGDGGVYALDGEHGTVNWRFPIDNASVYATFVANDTLFVATNSPFLSAVDVATGGERWNLTLDSPVATSPMVSGSVLYVTTTGGSLLALGTEPANSATVLPAADTTPADAPAAILWRAQNGAEPIREAGGMAIAPDGAIWVTEGGKNRFLIFSPDGKLQDVWEGPEDADLQFNFNWPGGGGSYGSVAFDSAGNIFVADTGNDRILKFDRGRNFIAKWGDTGTGDGQLTAPVNVSTDDAGNVIVSMDQGIQRFTNDGVFLNRIGSYGTEPDQYRCTALTHADPSGAVYVPDCDNSRIMTFDPEGKLLLTFGEFGRQPGKMNFPISVATDAAGNLFFTDSRNARVEVVDASGTFLAMWGGFGTEPGQFAETTALALDGAGNVHVTDYTSGNLQKFQLLPPLWPLAGTPVP